MNEYLNISRIESWLVGELKGRVSDNVFAGDLPDTLGSGWQDMAVVDVCSVRDCSEYGRGFGEAIANVFMYARDNSTGRKNVSRLNRMENDLAEIVENGRDEHYTLSELYSESGAEKSAGFHYKVTALQIQIF